MECPFSDIFVRLVDSVLANEYDKPITRKDYMTFFEMLERNLARRISGSFFSVEINNNHERKRWGRINYEGKTLWKLGVILKTLKAKRIIDSTGYLALPNKQGHARRYFYTQALLNKLDYSAFTLVFEEINEKVYNAYKKKKEYNVSDPQYGLLANERFSINTNECNEWLIEAYKADKISKENCLLNIRRVYDIFNKDVYVVKVRNGRVYSSFNSLKKELRQFCFIDGESLCSCDLKSSQPYLFATYLMGKYSTNPDVQRFFNLVTEDDIYIWLMNKNNEYFEKKIISREECKPAFYQYLFKKTNRGTNNTQRIIQRDLPELYQIVKEEKREFAFNEDNLANYLQGIESNLFIPVCEALANDGCLSVHDSLYFKPGLINDVKSRIITIFQERGLNPDFIKFHNCH